jgi:hypothetical protein
VREGGRERKGEEGGRERSDRGRKADRVRDEEE